MSRTLLRAGTLLGTTAVLAVAVASPAFAHVTANPDTIAKGGYGVVTFRVPDEDDTAGTVALTVNLPADHPFADVRTTPIAGWTATTNEITLNPPIKDDDGNQVTKTIGSVTWKANPGNKIAPGQYLDFPLSLGAFPDNTDVIRMPAVQTYDNGQVVNWSDPPNADGTEPEHPAPSVTLSAAASDEASHGPTATAAPADPPASASDDTARWLGGAGLLLGALGLGFGGGAFLRSRRAGKSG
jgi:periplasmic copper chaperone A